MEPNGIYLRLCEETKNKNIICIIIKYSTWSSTWHGYICVCVWCKHCLKSCIQLKPDINFFGSSMDQLLLSPLFCVILMVSMQALFTDELYPFMYTGHGWCWCPYLTTPWPWWQHTCNLWNARHKCFVDHIVNIDKMIPWWVIQSHW